MKPLRLLMKWIQMRKSSYTSSMLAFRRKIRKVSDHYCYRAVAINSLVKQPSNCIWLAYTHWHIIRWDLDLWPNLFYCLVLLWYKFRVKPLMWLSMLPNLHVDNTHRWKKLLSWDRTKITCCSIITVIIPEISTDHVKNCTNEITVSPVWYSLNLSVLALIFLVFHRFTFAMGWFYSPCMLSCHVGWLCCFTNMHFTRLGVAPQNQYISIGLHVKHQMEFFSL